MRNYERVFRDATGYTMKFLTSGKVTYLDATDSISVSAGDSIFFEHTEVWSFEAITVE